MTVTSFNSDKMYTYLRGLATGAGMKQTLKAMSFARDKHSGQFRKSGDPYIIHPLLMACNAVSIGIRDDAVVATILLHDVCEDCGVSLSELPVDDTVRRAVDLMTFRVMGGEPLMQKQLPELMQRLLAQPKLQHIQVVSNATLMPKDELLNLMSNNHRCSMFFSNYGPKVAPRYQEIVKHCQEHHVLVETLCPDISWFDMGDCSDRHLTPEQMAATYQRCPNNCRHIWNGEFHHCPRSAHAKYLGLIKDITEQDYVPLLALDAETRRARIRKMYDADYIKACNHCGFATGFHLIPCAIQAEKPSRRGPHADANAADANAADTSATVTGTLKQGNQAEQSAQVSSTNTPSMGLVDTSATALNLNSSVNISALTTPTSAATSTASTASAVASAAPAAAPASVAGMKQVGTVGGLKVYAQRHANNHKKSKKKRR